MKLEIKVLKFSMINNFLIALIKIIGGIFFNLGSLIADGMHTFSDFITDIVCMIGSKISRKKPTKYHPFGFGKVEYLSNLFVGIILLALSVFIIIGSFNKKTTIPSLTVLFLLGLIFIMKLISIIVMNRVGKKINSQLLITSVKESTADLYSSIGVIIITILLQFSNKFEILKYSDMIGSILIGILVLKTAFQIIIDNSLSLIGEVEEDEKIINEIKDFILKEKTVKEVNINLIKYGSYYKLQLTLELDSNLSLREISKIENKLKKDLIRHRSFKIKYVTIYVTNKID